MADSSISNAPGAAPDQPKNTKGGFQGGGRKLIGSGANKENKRVGGPAAVNGNGEGKDKKTAHHGASLEELDRLLEEDALELMNMRRNMAGAQEIELQKAHRMLASMKKEYNDLKIKNDEKELAVRKVNDKIVELQAIQATKENIGSKVEDVYSNLRKEIAEINEQIENESRLKKMQDHILNRLDDEITVCKKESAVENTTLEAAIHDYTVLSNTLQAANKDLLDLEKKMDKMITTIKFRKQQREEKMGMLNSIVLEGQNQMEKVQNASISDTSSHFIPGTKKLGQPTTPGKQSSPVKSSVKTEDDFGTILSISKSVDPNYISSLTIEQVGELSDRYINKDMRYQKLENMDEELRKRIADQKEKRDSLEERLSRAAIKYQQMASSRQIYQEVDMKDAALTAARKESEVCKEREHQLNIHMESLRKAVPRLLTKLTKIYHPVPSPEQVTDAVRKLEDEITKCIKVIQASMLKEATPEDLAIASSMPTTGRDVNASELTRLHSVPGYSKLKTLLFYNLMSSQPDNSQYNIRIDAKERKKMNEFEDGHDNKGDSKKKAVNHKASSTSFGTDRGDDDYITMLSNNNGAISGEHQGYHNATLDRDTIKSIAKLFVDKDQLRKTKLLEKSKAMGIDTNSSPTKKP